MRARLGAAGRERVEREFTLERLRERLRAFYEEMAVVPSFPSAC
jgi:glycosyltransferase involved in cell wall biosynthesis